MVATVLFFNSEMFAMSSYGVNFEFIISYDTVSFRGCLITNKNILS